jgi:hypothetical protein
MGTEIAEKYFKRFNGKNRIDFYLDGIVYHGSFYGKVVVGIKAVTIWVSEWDIRYGFIIEFNCRAESAVGHAIIEQHIAIRYFIGWKLHVRYVKYGHLNC